MIGKLFVNTVTESGRLSQIVREIASDRNILPNAQDVVTADDFYTVVQTSYDTNLIDKGMCSSTPITIAVIPFTKLTQDNNAEADILNIQRNLDTVSISNVNDVINSLTGTLSSDVNTSLDDRSQIDSLRSATSKITSAYNAKASYMTHLAGPYEIETNSDFDNSYGEGSLPASIPITKITSFEKKVDWIESYLNVDSSTLNSGYNIKNLLQILRNSFARKIYGPNFYISGQTSSLYVRPLNIDAYNAAATYYFGDLTNVSDASTLNLSDENTDILIIADSKSISYTRAGTNFESEASTLIGDLTAYTSGLSLSKSTNAGSFSSLLQYEDEGKSVLPLDVNIGDQATLSSYESADEFFLGVPLANDRTQLPSRTSRFSTDATSIESSILANIGTLVAPAESDLFTLNVFLAQMRFMLEDSFYTTNNTTSIMRFALLMAALNDTETRKRIFKVMMLRDRLINASDYVDSNEKSAFESSARIALDTEVFNLIKHVVPEYATRNTTSSDDDIINTMNLSLGRTLNAETYNSDYVPVEFDVRSDSAGEELLDELITGLNDPSSHQWDNFFKAARNVESASNKFLKMSPASTGSRSGASVLNYKVGMTTTLTKFTRDERAFLFFNKWISIIDDFPFKIEFIEGRYPRSDSSGNFYYKRKIDIKAYYSNSDYADLKNSLTLTLSEYTPAQFTYYVEYIQPLARSILQDTQTFYDGIDYVYRFIMQASSLLSDASSLAYAYTPTFGENLANHYTSNAILNLNRQAKLAFSRDSTYQNFSKDQYKSSNTLNGFLRYIQDDSEISEIQDSIVAVCGIPYGMLDRLGAFNQNKIGYVDVTVTLRPIGGSETGDIEIIKSYPVGGYVEHQYLSYDSTTNASYQQVLDATSLYELNANRALATNDQFDELSKQNELQSTALLNYIQLFYGLTFDYNITNQRTLSDITDTNTTTAIESFKEKIYGYRFDELVESRYISTGENSLRFARSNIITKALGGGVFDKVVAIPIDASLLKGSKDGYLVDILMSINTRFVDREEPVVTRTATRAGSNLLSNLQSTIRQSVTSTAVAAANFNIRGGS